MLDQNGNITYIPFVKYEYTKNTNFDTCCSVVYIVKSSDIDIWHMLCCYRIILLYPYHIQSLPELYLRQEDHE
ncbi:hypothetical protein B1779_01525 [Dehalococcoides mccartyi]|nr:hypothetical protein B1779_01525 [Dehalococcoides mccartyi]